MTLHRARPSRVSLWDSGPLGLSEAGWPLRALPGDAPRLLLSQAPHGLDGDWVASPIPPAPQALAAARLLSVSTELPVRDVSDK